MTEPLIRFEMKIRSPKNLAKFDPVDRQFLLWATPILRDSFMAQNLKGKSADCRKFPDYTARYKRIKTEKGTYSGTVDYRDSGGLLASISIAADKRGYMRIYFAGTHSTVEATKTVQKSTRLRWEKHNLKVQRLRQQNANYRGKMKDLDATIAMRNRDLADLLGLRYGTAKFFKSYHGRPPFPYMEPTREKQGWILQQYEQRVWRQKVKGLPPAMTTNDIPPALRKYVTVSAISA